MSTTAKTPSAVKAHCNRCGQSTNHRVLKRVTDSWVEELDDRFEIAGGDTFSLVRCLGCERVHLKHDSWFSEDVGDNGSPATRTRYYPPAVARREPKWIQDLYWGAPDVSELLKEIYSAVHNDARALAAMGIRALLEHVIIEQVGDTGSIGNNVTRFIEMGHVAPKSEQVFRDCLIESGHAAMHRGFKPASRDLDVLLDLTEGILASIYVHPQKAASVKIPKRRPSNIQESSEGG